VSTGSPGRGRGMRGGQQHEQDPRVQPAVHRGGQRAGREQQRIAGQKRREDEPGLGKDDRKQDAVDPGAVGVNELDEVLVEVEDEIDHASACLMSSMRSCGSSIPAEMRTMLSVRPMAWRRSGGTDACVMEAGWQMSVSTPPRLSASAISSTRLQTSRAASNVPTSNESMPPKPRICRVASACCGRPGRPGENTRVTFGCDARYSASARPLALCCAIRTVSVFVPRSTSHESNGLRIAPAAFWMKRSHATSSSRVAITTPPTLSLWP